MTIRQQGGVFGRNPVFNNVEATGDVDANGDISTASGVAILNGNSVFGQQFTIADDAVAVITPPREGGFAFVSGFTGAAPQLRWSGVFGFDVGSSENKVDISLGTDFVTAIIVGIPTGTSGTDGKLTVYLTDPGNGNLYFNNRSGSVLTISLTII